MIWYGVPFFGIMVVAALQSIPTEVYEAADIDGASSWTKLWSVTLPYIKQTVIITVLLRVIWVFHSADLIYIMTNGGPADTSYNLLTYVLSKVFVTSDFGQASALAIVMLVILVVYTIIFFRVTKYEHAGDF